MTRRALHVAAVGLTAATLGAGFAGVAAAERGSDDPPGDDRGGARVDDDRSSGDERRHGRRHDDSGVMRGRETTPSAGGPRAHASGSPRSTRRRGSRADVRRTGTCTRASTAKIKLSPEDGRIEVEAEVDQNRSRARWRWTMRRGTRTLARGGALTRPPSGSFEVRRVVSDTAGRDRITFRAVGPSGEVCTARATL